MKLNIEVSLAGVKTFVGRITGTDAQYGFALDFAPKTQVSRTLSMVAITDPGQYKLTPGATVGCRRIDTGYIRVDDAGIVTEITKDEVAL